MDVLSIIATMRSGNGRLRPIINHYAETRRERELEPYLEDPEIADTVLYVLSELPSVDARLVASIKRLIDEKRLTVQQSEWAKDIVFNHG